MSVEVVRGPIVKAWKQQEDGRVFVGVRSKHPVAELVRLTEEAVDLLHAELLDRGVGVGTVAPTSRGVAVVFDHCVDRELLDAALDLIAGHLGEAGVGGRLSVLSPVWSAVNDLFNPLFGYAAALSLKGSLADGPVNGELRPRWITDTGVLDRVIEHALEWCQVPGGEFWVQGGEMSSKVAVGDREALLRASLHAEPNAKLVAADGRNNARQVVFMTSGHVAYSLGGEPAPEWEDAVAVLRDVLVELRSCGDYGLIQRRHVRGYGGMNVGLWLDLSHNLWSPHRAELIDRADRAVLGATRLDHDVERSKVSDVYGIQLLSNDHELPMLPPSWVAEPVGDGMRLVSHREPQRWFAEEPTFELLMEARRELSPLLTTDY